MPWKRVQVDEERMRFVMRAVSGQEPMAALCREFGIARPTGYLWRQRYLKTRNLGALAEGSRRPQRSPGRTAIWKEERVVALRQQTGWGAKKLQVLLHQEEQLDLPVRTIHRILERHELLRAGSHGAAPQRFQRSTPNELWQMDTKGKYPLSDGQCHALSILDDHSRYAVGLYALRELSTAQAYPCLVKTFRRYGLPQAMLMDHGSLWWATTNGWGLTRLSLRLIEQGIRLLYGRIAHPQTQGKVERFHRTLGEALRHRGVPEKFAGWPAALAEFQSSYNQRRPHEALGMQRPADRYQPSARHYQEQVRPWEYPQGSEVRRLNGAGSLSEAGQRWFVCAALADQQVCVERFDGKLLVSYRNMYIREIDLERQRTRPLVVERGADGEAAAVALRAPSAASPEEKQSPGRQSKV